VAGEQTAELSNAKDHYAGGVELEVQEETKARFGWRNP
jgi:hypothetical protein